MLPRTTETGTADGLAAVLAGVDGADATDAAEAPSGALLGAAAVAAVTGGGVSVEPTSVAKSAAARAKATARSSLPASSAPSAARRKCFKASRISPRSKSARASARLLRTGSGSLRSEVGMTKELRD